MSRIAVLGLAVTVLTHWNGDDSLELRVGQSKLFMSHHRTVLSDGRPGVSFVVYAGEELAMVSGRSCMRFWDPCANG